MGHGVMQCQDHRRNAAKPWKKPYIDGWKNCPLHMDDVGFPAFELTAETCQVKGMLDALGQTAAAEPGRLVKVFDHALTFDFAFDKLARVKAHGGVRFRFGDPLHESEIIGWREQRWVDQGHSH